MQASLKMGGGKTYNTAVIIGPPAKAILKHRKNNDPDIAHDLYDQGDGLNQAHTPIGIFDLRIIADATATGVPFQRYGQMGADTILSPRAWALPTDFDNEVTV